MKGTIMFYKEEKGYGFITPDKPDPGIYPADYPFVPDGKLENVFFHIKKAHQIGRAHV